MQIAFFLGRNSTLAFAELQAVLGQGTLTDNGLIAIWETDQTPDLLQLQRRLGGVLSSAKIVATALTAAQLEDEVKKLLVLPEQGKYTLGLSSHGKAHLPLERMALNLKKYLKQQGASVRYILPKEGSVLSSAQLLHNHLAVTDPQNAGNEFVFWEEKGAWILGVTQTIQDIEWYSKRDYAIPEPNAVAGMLPPKLAQTLINLAVHDESDQKTLVYDPFCGSGRIVSEARLMGLASVGSDLSGEQVSASQKNVAWIAEQYGFAFDQNDIWPLDATNPEGVFLLEKYIKRAWYIVTEPYLGEPLRQAVSDPETWLAGLETLYLDFFTLWANASVKPSGMVVVFPRARQQNGTEVSLFSHLVDRLQGLGYTETQVAVYGRPDAFVRREIVQIAFSK